MKRERATPATADLVERANCWANMVEGMGESEEPSKFRRQSSFGHCPFRPGRVGPRETASFEARAKKGITADLRAGNGRRQRS